MQGASPCPQVSWQRSSVGRAQGLHIPVGIPVGAGSNPAAAVHSFTRLGCAPVSDPPAGARTEHSALQDALEQLLRFYMQFKFDGNSGIRS